MRISRFQGKYSTRMFILQGLNLTELEYAFSSPRLSSYASLTGTTATDANLGAYLWGLELSAAFGPLLSVVEVSLRNAIHAAGSAQFARADWLPIVLRHAGDRQWLLEVTKQPGLASQKYRATASLHNKKTLTIAGVVQKLAPWKSPAEEKYEALKNSLAKKRVPPQPHNLVANAMLGFWVDLVDSSFIGSSLATDLWPAALPAVFPNLGATPLGTIASDLRIILAFRNRVFHHEPVWRVGPGTTPLKAEMQLSALVLKIERLIAAISVDLHSALCKTGFIPRLRWLVTSDAINAFSTCVLPTPPEPERLEDAIQDVLRGVHATALPPAVLRPDRAITLSVDGSPKAVLVALN